MNFNPDWVSPPGEAIYDLMQEMDISEYDLSSKWKTPVIFIIRLIAGIQEIDESLAKKISETFGSTTKFWLEREKLYRESTHYGLPIVNINGKNYAVGVSEEKVSEACENVVHNNLLSYEDSILSENSDLTLDQIAFLRESCKDKTLEFQLKLFRNLGFSYKGIVYDIVKGGVWDEKTSYEKLLGDTGQSLSSEEIYGEVPETYLEAAFYPLKP